MENDNVLFYFHKYVPTNTQICIPRVIKASAEDLAVGLLRSLAKQTLGLTIQLRALSCRSQELQICAMSY